MDDSGSDRISVDEGEGLRHGQSHIARLAIVALLAATTTLAFMMLAGASHQDLRDGDDTRGSLDVRKVKTFRPTKKPVWRIITDERWIVRRIHDRGFALVNLDTFGDARFDYYALIGSNGSRMKGALWRDRTSRRDRRVSKLAAWRADRRSVSVRIPLRKVKRGTKRLEYRWYVQTLYTSSNCKQVCIDRAPNRGAIRDPNGRTPPKPTLSPDETP